MNKELSLKAKNRSTEIQRCWDDAITKQMHDERHLDELKEQVKKSEKELEDHYKYMHKIMNRAKELGVEDIL